LHLVKLTLYTGCSGALFLQKMVYEVIRREKRYINTDYILSVSEQWLFELLRMCVASGGECGHRGHRISLIYIAVYSHGIADIMMNYFSDFFFY
jgi:hypothetical protein